MISDVGASTDHRHPRLKHAVGLTAFARRASVDPEHLARERVHHLGAERADVLLRADDVVGEARVAAVRLRATLVAAPGTR